MKKTFGTTHVLILIALLTLILAPRPISGALDLKTAEHLEVVGDFAQAASAYISAAQRLPWQPSLWEKAGDTYLEGKDYSNSEYCYGMADRGHTLSPSGYIRWGDVEFALGNQKFAIDIWNDLLKKGGDPSILLPRIARSIQVLAISSPQDSFELYNDEIQTWQKYLLGQPGDAAAHYRLGLLLMAFSPADALPELMQAAHFDPELVPTIEGLRTTLNKTLLSDDRSEHFLVAGQALGALGEWNLAAEAFHIAISERKDSAEGWAWLGEAEQQRGQDGGKEIEQALAFNPGSAIVQGLNGLFLQRNGKLEAALTAFHKAAELEPGNPAWQIALGSASEQVGDLVAAYGYYFHAMELAPEDASTWRALAIFSVTNVVDVDVTGLPAARKLIGLAPDDWQSYDLAGQAEFLLEDFPAAEIYLKKAVQMNPTLSAPALHLGLVYMQMGDRTSAYSYLILAKTFDPEGSDGWQAGRLLGQYFP